VSLPSKGVAHIWKNLPDFSDLTVLVVEDDADSRELLREVLHACGASVLEADNVQTAKECVSTLKTNLIVTDLALPGDDGASFLRWLREQPRHRGGNLPVIAVTAYSKDYPPTEVTGWAAYFQKPLNIDEFVNTIAAILKRTGRREP
jgi:DNA-binding response OmpR family regulator